MREKKMGMRRLAACVLVAALALGGAATTLATPTVAEAYPQGATFPIRSKDDLSYYEKDKPVVLKAGEDYVLAGTVDIDHYESRAAPRRIRPAYISPTARLWAVR